MALVKIQESFLGVVSLSKDAREFFGNGLSKDEREFFGSGLSKDAREFFGSGPSKDASLHQQLR